MLTVQVQRLERQYRLRDSQQGLRPRLDDLTETLVNDYLERALERRGIAPSDELCIRFLHLDLHYANGLSDGDCLRAWSERLATAIELELERGDGTRVVRYRSRVEAYLDVAHALIARQWQRSWAWQTLGIACSEPTVTRVAQDWHARLLREPQIGAYLRALMASGLLPALLGQTPLVAADFEMLAQAAVAQAGRSIPVPGAGQHDRARSPDRYELAKRIVRLGAAGAALTDYATPTAALSVWPLIEAEPALLRRPQRDLDTILLAVAEVLAGSGRDGRTDDAAEALPAKTPTPYAPSADRELMPPANDAVQPSTAQTPPHAPAAGQQRPDDAEQTPLPLRDDPPGHEAAAPLPEPDEAVESPFGGLLMLINVTRYYDFVSALCDDSERPLGWLLERMTIGLLDVPDDDVALAVLCDRAPDEPLWREREPGIETPETRLIDEVVANLTGTLRELLPRIDPDKVVDVLCRRRARLEVSPGWVTAVFDLDEADAAIRRAGLDLHPEYVDWLGRIVRFDYE